MRDYERLQRLAREGDWEARSHLLTEARRRSDTFAELLGWVWDRPGASAWKRICALAQACEAGRLRGVMSWLVSDLERHWPDELRVLPQPWVDELRAGLDPVWLGLGCVLRISDRPLTSDDVVAMATSESLSRLRVVEFRSYTQLDAEGLLRLLKQPAFETVRVLDLKENGFGDLGVSALCQHPMEHLRELNLALNGLGPQSARSLSRWSALAGVELLDLGWNPLGVAGTRTLAGAPSSKLARLNLEGVNMGDVGAAALAQAAWPQLEQLQLGWNQIGDVGIEALSQTQGFPKLRRLELRRNPLGIEAREWLRHSTTLARTRILL